MKTQQVVEVEWEDIPGQGVSNGRYKPVLVDRKPSHVWTFLLPEGAPKPELPVHPVHNDNVFSEDYVHDWDFNTRSKLSPNGQQGALRYYTRIFHKRNVWLLLEFNEAK